MLNRNTFIPYLLAAAAGAVLAYLFSKYKERYVAPMGYGVSCMQVCGMARPGGAAACEKSVDDPECALYHGCINECRSDQSQLQLEQRFAMNGTATTDGWEGNYGKLL